MAKKYLMDLVFWGSIRTVARGDNGLQKGWRKQCCHVFSYLKSPISFLFKNSVSRGLIFTKSNFYQSLDLSA